MQAHRLASSLRSLSMSTYTEKIFTQPTVEPVTLTEAKSHLRVIDTLDDTPIASRISVAREQIEQWTDLALLTQTWDYWTPRRFCGSVIKIPRGPVKSVTVVEQIDDSGVATALDASAYVVDLISEPCEVRLLAPVSGRLHLRYVAGEESPADVAKPLKQAILLLIGALYENRSEEMIATSSLTTIRLSLGVDSLIRNYQWGDR